MLHSLMINRKYYAYALLALWLSPAASTAEPAVQVYLDKASAGWAYKSFDYAFVAEQDNCRIQWNAAEDKEGGRWLAVRRNCKADFSGQVALHRAILKEIAHKWPLPSFKSIDWGPLCDEGDWDWCRPIAKASLRSKDFIDYYKHYPHSKLTGLNGLFVELANATACYAPLAELLREFGTSIKLGAVEKVFYLPVIQSPFAEEFKTLAAAKNPKMKLMYNAGMAYFTIVK